MSSFPMQNSAIQKLSFVNPWLRSKEEYMGLLFAVFAMTWWWTLTPWSRPRLVWEPLLLLSWTTPQTSCAVFHASLISTSTKAVDRWVVFVLFERRGMLLSSCHGQESYTTQLWAGTPTHSLCFFSALHSAAFILRRLHSCAFSPAAGALPWG